MRWLLRLHNQLSLFLKVFILNSFILVFGMVGSFALAHLLRAHTQGLAWSLALEFVMVGLLITLAANYFLLRFAFDPTFQLREVMEQVRSGNYQARVPPITGDPDVARLGESVNQALDELARHRQEVSAKVLAAMEEERKRVARELHDDTAQSLGALLIHLEMLEQALPEDDPLRHRVHQTTAFTAKTLDGVRRLMYDLRPGDLDHLGLVPALNWYIKNRIQPAGLEVHFEATGLQGRLPEALETGLFRLVQEALNNVLKHARAKRVQVRLEQGEGRIRAIVQDDGRGFDPAQRSKGLGLTGMYERVELLKGELEISSEPARGTTVRIEVPIESGG